jgi:hypothetical protein
LIIFLSQLLKSAWVLVDLFRHSVYGCQIEQARFRSALTRNVERNPSRQFSPGGPTRRVCRPLYLFLTPFFNPHFISSSPDLGFPLDDSSNNNRPPSARGRRAWRWRATSSAEREPHERAAGSSAEGEPRECPAGSSGEGEPRRGRAGKVISASSPPPPASNTRMQLTLAIRLGCRRGFHSCATPTPSPSTSSPSSTLLPRCLDLQWCGDGTVVMLLPGLVVASRTRGMLSWLILCFDYFDQVFPQFSPALSHAI